MDQNGIVVCYMGGMFGDLLVGTIDSTNATFKNLKIQHVTDRSKLKKPHNFVSTYEKDTYLTEIFTQYKSIPSHDLDYHITSKHRFLGITVSDRKLAINAAARFQYLHAPHVWEEMRRNCGANSIDEYADQMLEYSKLIKQHTDLIMPLEDIYNGRAVKTLNSFGITIGRREKNFYVNGLDYVLNRMYI